MSKLRINDGVTVDYSDEGWDEYRKWLDGTTAKLRYVWTDEGASYFIVAPDGPFYRTLSMNKTDAGDFEARFKVATRVGNPVEEDGKQIVVISPATEGMRTWLTGRGDDIGAGPAGRGKGTKLKVAFDGTDPLPATKDVEVQFLEPVEVHDGQFNWDAAGFDADDYFSVSVVMPGSTPTNTPGTGNANEVPLGAGAVLYVPAAGDGSHTIDTEDWTKAVPVPANGAGYWDVDDDGVITPSVTPGNAEFHLVNFESEAFLIVEIGMQNSLGLFDVDVYKTEWIHPSWRICLSVTKSSSGTGTASGWLLTFRKNVTRT